MVGTILLNPRIMQYDAHAVALPMALILARSVEARSKAGIAVAVAVVLLMIAGFMGNTPASVDHVRSMFVLVAVMALGFQQLAVEARRTRAQSLVIHPNVSATSEPALVPVDAYQSDSQSYVPSPSRQVCLSPKLVLPSEVQGSFLRNGALK